jgi:hypothetical protein
LCEVRHRTASFHSLAEGMASRPRTPRPSARALACSGLAPTTRTTFNASSSNIAGDGQGVTGESGQVGEDYAFRCMRDASKSKEKCKKVCLHGDP